MSTMHNRQRATESRELGAQELRDWSKHSTPLGVDQQGRYQACASGPCERGAKLCPSPDTCQMPRDDGSLNAARAIIVWSIRLLAGWCALAALLVWLR